MPRSADSRVSRWTANTLLVLGACVLALAMFEGAARLLRQPCSNCWGTLLGVRLPPFRVITDEDFVETDRIAWFENLVVDGARITTGDLWGILREDARLGYAPQEDTASTNGWWQTNCLGARSRHEVETPRLPGIFRVLVFGDSFANSSRVPEEETWTAALGRHSERLDVVNFGVDGYSMAQAYLRYQGFKDRVDHDGVLLLFPPSATLLRDVNTLRNLMDWGMPLPVPCYVLQGDRLQHVEGPYRTVEDVRRANADGISPALLEYLRTYDALYGPAKYERRSFLDDFVWVKLLNRAVYTFQKRRLLDGMMERSSESMQVSRAIIQAMAGEVAADGKWFLLVFTPLRADLPRYAADLVFRERWDAMRDSVCPPSATCLDLMEALRAQPPEVIDAGYDGTHFGPQANARIAEALWGRIATLAPVLQDLRPVLPQPSNP